MRISFDNIRDEIMKRDKQNYIFVLEFVGSHKKNKNWRCDFDRREFVDNLSYLERINNGIQYMEKEGMGILWGAYILEPQGGRS